MITLASLGLVLAVASPVPAPISAFATAWAGMTSYQTTAHVYQVSGAKTQNSVYTFAFSKPASITMNIVSGPNAGATVTWSGGETVRAGKGMFTKTVNLKDPLVTSLRGLTVVDLSFPAILKHAQKIAGTAGISETTMNGAKVNVVNVAVSNPSKDHGLTRETLYLSAATNLPVRVDGYIGSQLVQTVSFSNTTTK